MISVITEIDFSDFWSWNSYYHNWESLIITENYWTSHNTNENLWTSLKMSENRWISMKIDCHLWKCLNIAEHIWKSVNITENVRTALNIFENLWSSLKMPEYHAKSLTTTVWTLKRSEKLCWRSSLPIGLRSKFCQLRMNYIYEKSNRKRK